MITHNKRGLFSSRIAAISGKNGAYVVSTAKQGIFQGLSTWFYESSDPPFGKTEWRYKIIYSDSVSKSQRLALHDKIVDKIESLVDVESESFIAGAGDLSLILEFNGYLTELESKNLVKDIYYPEPDFSK